MSYDSERQAGRGREARRKIIDFFNDFNVKSAVSRETLSRCLGIAYPTLDIVLARLEVDGLLLKTGLTGTLWRPSQSFVFRDVVSQSQIRLRALRDKKLAADKLRKEQIAARRAERVALRQAEWHRAELIRQAKREERKREAAEAAATEAARRASLPVTELPKAAPIVKRPALVACGRAEPPKPVEPAYDPWAIIRARAYAKPVLLPTELREPDKQKMMSRR